MNQLIIPYLMFENSLEVAEYYSNIFNGKISYVMKGKDMPNCPKEDLEKVMHLELEIKGHHIYMGDGPEKPSKQAMLLMNYDNLEEMKVAFKNMKETSEILEDLHDTFWGAVYGALKDKYGMIWEFNHMKPRA